MDPTFCPILGELQDRVIIPRGIESCVPPLGVYIALAFIIVFRLLVFALQTHRMLIVQSKRNRVSVTYLLDFILVIIHTIYFTLIGSYGEKVNVDNGSSPAIFFLLIWINDQGLLLNVIQSIHLGDKVIPKKFRKGDESSEELSKLWNHRGIASAILIGVLGQTLCLLCGTILNLADRTNANIYSRIALFSVGVDIFFLCSAGILQNRRLSAHIMKASIDVSSKEVGTARGKELAQVAARMKQRDRIWAVTSLHTIIYFLPAFGVFPFRFELALLTSAVSSFAKLSSTLVIANSKNKPTTTETSARFDRSSNKNNPHLARVGALEEGSSSQQISNRTILAVPTSP